MLTKIRLSPSGPEINLDLLLSSALASGFSVSVPKATAPLGTSVDTNQPAAFKTTEDSQTILLYYQFTIDEKAPGVTGESIVIQPLIDGVLAGQDKWQVVPVAISKGQSYAFLFLAKITSAGTHTVGFRVDATATTGDVDLFGDADGPTQNPDVLIFGATP